MIKPNELGQPVTEADLLPFVNAQAPVYSQVIEELTARFGCGPGRTVVAGHCVARTTIRHTRRVIRRSYY